MSINKVSSHSMVFDDSRVTIIPVDVRFNPLNSEGSMFCEIYKKAYESAKVKFLKKCETVKGGILKNKCFTELIGKSKRVVFIVNLDSRSNSIATEVYSVLNKFLDSGDSISLLSKDFNNLELKKLENVISYELRCFDTVFM